MIAGRVAELGRDLVGRHVPQQLLGDFQSLLLGLPHADEAAVGEPVDGHGRSVGFLISLAVAVENLSNPWVSGQEHCSYVPTLGHLGRRAGAPHGHPHRGMRLLKGPGPDVDLPRVEPAAFEVKRPLMMRPGLGDQVVGLPQLLGASVRENVGGGGLIGHSAHEPAFQPAPGDHVDQRHLLRHADGLAPVGNRVAQDQQAGVLGLPGENTQHDGRRRDHAGGRLVVFVVHDV